MRIFVKKILIVVGFGAVLASPVLHAASSKTTVADPVRACKIECKKQQDAAAYETCMLKCGALKKNRSVQIKK